MKPKLELVKRDEKRHRIELKLHGEDHTMANLIVKLAIRKPHVTYAAYRIDHPLVGEPVLIIATDGQVDPLDVLVDVLRDIWSLSGMFLEKLREASPGENR